jgi:formate dehydrogenase (coenzyme F420) beta subunit
MTKTALCPVTDGNLPQSLEPLFRSMLALDEIQAILIARHLPMKPMVMPVLISDPERLEQIDPFAPAFAMNAAKLVARLSRKPAGGKMVVVLRPCEIRAYIELIKLKQGIPDDIIIVGIDCPGAFKNTDYLKFADAAGADATATFLKAARAGGELRVADGIGLTAACKACEQPAPDGADLLIGIFGMDIDREFLVAAQTPKGEALFDQLQLAHAAPPDARAAALAGLVTDRTAARDAMFTQTREQTADLEKLAGYLSACVNCYNCRVACPVCYCRECVFVTDVFDHEPFQYLRWAKRKGAIKMPTDTLFYHLTRLAHMSTACVGCGQCSNACPNDIPLMELFRSTAHVTQADFGYQAGRSIDEAPPLSVFRENEFAEVTGGKH